MKFIKSASLTLNQFFNMEILITGGAGFLGFHLAKLLASEKKNHIVLVDNFFRGKKDSDLKKLLKNRRNVELKKIDLTNARELKKLDKGYDYVYHLAAINGTQNFYEIPHIVLRNNVLSAINLLDWFIVHKTKKSKIFLASSSETYAGSFKVIKDFPIPTPENVPLTIEDVTNPRWSYGGSKMIKELLFLNYAKIYGIRMSIVRYHNVYGPRMGYGHVVPEFFERLYRKEDPFSIFGGKETRAFCYVEDMVWASQEVMEIDKTDGEIVNIGNDQEEITIKELAQRVFNVTGFHPYFNIKPAPQGSVARRCPDLTKIKKLTSYRPRISLDEGLKKTWEWYKNDLAHNAKTTHS